MDIELVIKLPEEIYKASQFINVKYEDVVQIPLEVIANGTPLPKGHGRLIDENDLDGEYTCSLGSGHECISYRSCSECPDHEWRWNNDVSDVPTIIEADTERNEEE